MKTKTVALRIPEEIYNKLKSSGVNMSELFRAPLNQIYEAIKERECPTCGQKLKEKK